MRSSVFGIIVISAILLSSFLSMEITAHAPSDMTLQYDYDDQLLTVTITHTAGGSAHYVDRVIIYRNDIPIIDETYEEQPDPITFSYEYEIFAVDGDVLKAWAHCSLTGEIEEELTVEGPREYMTLNVNPDPVRVEYGMELDLTVNIYRFEDGTPLDGVVIVAVAALGYVGEISDLGLGGYGFTYSAPNPEDTEDIEVINLSCTKNGYHPLYHEFSFDLVFAEDDSRDIVVMIDPNLYRLDEGEKVELSVSIKAGEEYLDVPDIDVDYSFGKLSKERTGTGRFKLTYTANHLDSDTTGFIKISASRSGYTTGYKELQFQIKDIGDGPVTPNEDENSFFQENRIPLIIGSIIVIAAGLFVAFFIWRGKQEEDDEYEKVQIAEIIDNDIQRY